MKRVLGLVILALTIAACAPARTLPPPTKPTPEADAPGTYKTHVLYGHVYRAAFPAADKSELYFEFYTFLPGKTRETVEVETSRGERLKLHEKNLVAFAVETTIGGLKKTFELKVLRVETIFTEGVELSVNPLVVWEEAFAIEDDGTVEFFPGLAYAGYRWMVERRFTADGILYPVLVLYRQKDGTRSKDYQENEIFVLDKEAYRITFVKDGSGSVVLVRLKPFFQRG